MYFECIVGAFWGGFMVHLGCILGAVGVFWVHFWGGFRVHLGAFRVPFESVVGAFWGGFRVRLGCI